ncbi:hypothetical protein K2173_017243 [Erythroxylum novogranatense]|uniref:Zinc knuckle CX2CX4HX4C domain-containing protein n=1 Tax=Erythroxylum novogranatense TaxID=1862640 RepID=A0AAV8U654_9ROSI|nr:hypothetical protein K2173_017243 [Erythroxylum novogranatense]
MAEDDATFIEMINLSIEGDEDEAMKQTLASFWQPFMGVTISKETEGLYLFRFYHNVDVERTLDMYPCTFLNNLFLLNQIHGLDSGFRFEAVLKRLGNFLGEFVSSDPNNFHRSWNSYMQIRIKKDVRTPIVGTKKLRHEKGNWFTVSFVWEKLPNVCFICGMLDHTEKFCRCLLESHVKQVVHHFSPEIRASRRNQSTIGSRWLVEGPAVPNGGGTDRAYFGRGENHGTNAVNTLFQGVVNSAGNQILNDHALGDNMEGRKSDGNSSDGFTFTNSKRRRPLNDGPNNDPDQVTNNNSSGFVNTSIMKNPPTAGHGFQVRRQK